MAASLFVLFAWGGIRSSISRTVNRTLRHRQEVQSWRTNRNAGQIETNYDEVTDSFDAMNLKQELLRGKSLPLRTQATECGLTVLTGVYAYGFERPSAIQSRAIMPVIKGQLLGVGKSITRGSR